MRLIDADAFSARMYHEVFEKDNEDQRWDSGCWIRYKLFEKVLKETPIIEPEQKWIPCSERLPKDDDYKPFSYYEDGVVFFCTKDGKVGFGWYYESTREWANEDDNTVGDVIAWMPLPSPWKGE